MTLARGYTIAHHWLALVQIKYIVITGMLKTNFKNTYWFTCEGDLWACEESEGLIRLSICHGDQGLHCLLTEPFDIVEYLGV